MNTKVPVKYLILMGIFNIILLGLVLVRTEKFTRSLNPLTKTTKNFAHEGNSTFQGSDNYASVYTRLVLNIDGETFDDTEVKRPLNSFGIIRGWVVEKNAASIVGFNPAETYTIRKGQYTISIGLRPTGVDTCYPEYFVIQDKDENNTLGLLTRSDLENPLRDDGYFHDDGQFLTLNICEDNISTTKIGSIQYKVPKSYNPQILTEMDTIIKAISIQENMDYYCYSEKNTP